MATYINIEEFLLKRKTLPVIDVRSPAEYSYARFPGAYNIPLFNDEERAVVGTKYKQENREAAVMAGLKFVGPKMTAMLKKAIQLAPGREVLVHCWRGGMRSQSLAFLLETAGFKVYLLKGGYKAMRQLAMDYFGKIWNLIVLGGYTGSGKTYILDAIKKKGEQVIDLEGLANHKGSAFGSIGMEKQPSTEYFENLLFLELLKMDEQKPIWVEDESHAIGKVNIPHTFFLQKQASPMINLEIPAELRIKHLVEDYTGCSDEELKAAFEKITKRLGGNNLKDALEALQEKDYITAAKLALVYYDKSYKHCMIKKEEKNVVNIASVSISPGVNAGLVLEAFNTGFKSQVQHNFLAYPGNTETALCNR